MIEDQGWCSGCGTMLYRHVWKRPIIPEIHPFTDLDLNANTLVEWEMEEFYVFSLEPYDPPTPRCPVCKKEIRAWTTFG